MRGLVGDDLAKEGPKSGSVGPAAQSVVRSIPFSKQSCRFKKRLLFTIKLLELDSRLALDVAGGSEVSPEELALVNVLPLSEVAAGTAALEAKVEVDVVELPIPDVSS